MKLNLIQLAFILTFLGLAVSIYLYLAKYDTIPLVCGFSSCDIVNQSKYSFFLGLPISLFGIIYYGACLLALYTKRMLLFYLITITGVGFSIYLTIVEAFLIHAFCQWCLFSAWITICQFILSLRLKSYGNS